MTSIAARFMQEARATSPELMRRATIRALRIEFHLRRALPGGFFNIFNTAYTVTGVGLTNVDLTLETTCNRRVDHVPDGAGGYADGVCDLTAGFSFTPNTMANFGKINVKRGHRVIELVVKYYF